MPKGDIKTSISYNMDRLNKKLDRLAKTTGKSLNEIVVQAGEMFAQSAAIATPPKDGVMKKRTIIPLNHNRYDARHGVMHTSKTRYKVPYRTDKKKGAKYFGSMSEAKEFAPIRYRFIGKGSWLIAIEKAIGKKVSSKYWKSIKPIALEKLQSLTRGKHARITFTPSITLVSSVQNLSRYANYAIAIALRKTNNRVKKWAQGEFKKKLQQGGSL